MPPISLVVCVHNERQLLDRLIERSAGCHDDFVVVHDGPDVSGVRPLVERSSGRFFERQREYQQEPHWPFAWEQARYDWILRLDADEFPGEPLKAWLREFRQMPDPGEAISGYTCAWPLWNGRRKVSNRWPSGRNFLFHRGRVRFFGMVEQVPIADQAFLPLDLVLEHQPLRKSYGLKNILVRPQAYRWRERIATSLLGKPTDLACWRWDSEGWPSHWEEIRRKPLRTALKRLVLETLRGLRSQWRSERRFWPDAALNSPVHHALICLKYWQLKRD